MMKAQRLQEKLKCLNKEKRALLATNFYNFETLHGILDAARTSRKSIILQATKSSIEYLGLPVLVKLADSMLNYHGVEAWLHLDHGDSIELVSRCLDAGFQSVMIDGSEYTFEKNVAVTKQAVALAERYDVTVEAELGYVAKLGQDTEIRGFTEPEDAKRFVEETGVNMLAVAIGSSHGFYKKPPKLDLERLAAIKKAVNIPLVLHGSSGIPHDMLRQSISLGICKINLATEIKNIFMQTLKTELLHSEEIDLRKTFPPATAAVSKLVNEKLVAIDN